MRPVKIGATMKKVALLPGCAVAFACVQLSVAGPEPIQPQESKAVVQPPPPECTWTGFYFGGHAGYAWGDASFKENFQGDPSFDFDRAGFFGGGQVGFNLQLGHWFVVGAEGTFSGWDGNDDITVNAQGEQKAGHLDDSNWIGTVGGRVGISFLQNRLLGYVKGGVAFSQWSFTEHEIGGTETFRLDDDNTSGFVGGGLEYALTCHWSVRLEWNHIFLNENGNRIGTETDSFGSRERSWHVDVGDIDTVTAGINFKF